MQSAIEISAMPDRSPRERLSQEAAEQIAADFQPLLLGYYLAMQRTVKNSDVATVGLSFRIGEMYENLAACTPNDYQLQTELLSALKEQDEVSRMTRSTETDVVIIESLLSFCHEGTPCVYVGDVTDTALDILEQRGGDPSLSPHEVGGRIRLMQLQIEPRDGRGFRVKLTETTIRQIHKLALDHDVPAMQGEITRCDYCRELMRVASQIATGE